METETHSSEFVSQLTFTLDLLKGQRGRFMGSCFNNKRLPPLRPAVPGALLKPHQRNWWGAPQRQAAILKTSEHWHTIYRYQSDRMLALAPKWHCTLFFPQLSAAKPKLPGTNSRDSYLHWYFIWLLGSIIQLVAIRTGGFLGLYYIRRYCNTAQPDDKSVSFSGPFSWNLNCVDLKCRVN